MGNVCSPSFSCDDTISRCLHCTVRKARYVCNLQDNIHSLQEELRRLTEVRNDVKIRIIVAEQQQMKPLEQVHGWLSRVQEVETKVEKLKEEECPESRCTKSTYKLGKKVFRTLREVRSLRQEGDFKDVAQPVPENPVDERPLPPTVVGLQLTFDRVWRCLMEEHVGIVGLYGMGGVGKTTLLTQINNRFFDTPNHFDFVIWVVVSRDLQLEKIQEIIAKKIGLFNESWKNKSMQEKAQQIFNILSKKKFVLLLDDMWELVDLDQVGLPIPSRTSVSNKVVFTTREFEVCGQMEAHRSFKVECLRYDDAWKLFELKVGADTLDSHPDIPELAETLAKDCGGLPLALITVGRAMASRKTPREWEHAIEVLRSSASKFAEGYTISIEDLIDCWICEGFLDDHDGIEARNQGYSLIRNLLHACLLEEEKDNSVKMHYVVRDMALWIASTMDNKKEKFLVLTGAGLTEAPSVGMWKDVTRMSLMDNKIKRLTVSPTSPRLLTLFLNSNYFKNDKVNYHFFKSMASLRVLKLSHSDLPCEISNLVSLQYLDLSNSIPDRLPLGLKYLVNLKCLNLEYTFRLSRISPQVISNLKMLRVLRMFECGSFLDSLVEELLGLEHLNVLTITLHSNHALQRLLSSSRFQSISIPSLCLRGCRLEPFTIFSLASLRHLQTLHLVECNDLEDFMIACAGEMKKIREIHGFHSLQNVYISHSKLRQVTWLILAPNLKHLEVQNCPYMEEIINIGKLGEVPAEVMENLTPFARLEYLILKGLNNLKNICSNALPFPRLKEMSVHECSKLRQLALDCNCGLERKIIIEAEERWWKQLQWDDQATQNAFHPYFKSQLD
ncbi:disease resistance protein SUMM2-like [Citrus sinensis]|uniref:disease resistance protein SUMM2-like n=1 Tax=Citrus sinensis TaxID=2711 RepID=UPI0022774516|nr:disease resistance protein SUMM2-like [Citrus sinensis]